MLGCSGTFPGPAGPCSSYLVEYDGFRLLLDIGTGSLSTLQQVGGLFDVDAVLLSHLHADHCLDLVSYTYARRYHPDGSPPPLPVYGPGDTPDRIRRAFERSSVDPLQGIFDMHPVTEGTLDIGPFTVTLARMAHPVECYGARLEAGGRTLTYSADTGPCDSLDKIAHDSDLLLSEASFLEGAPHPPDLHLTAREAADCASRSDARRLLLTHLVAWNDEARSLEEARGGYTGDIDLARVGASYDV